MRSLFRQATRCAPCIIFIDEIEDVGETQLLTAMDSLQAHEGIVTLAATNRADFLSEAIVERFSRRMQVMQNQSVDGCPTKSRSNVTDKEKQPLALRQRRPSPSLRQRRPFRLAALPFRLAALLKARDQAPGAVMSSWLAPAGALPKPSQLLLRAPLRLGSALSGPSPKSSSLAPIQAAPTSGTPGQFCPPAWRVHFA